MYDKAKADRAVNFIRLLKLTDDKWYGMPFPLQDWQEQIVRSIFGEMKPDGSGRQYRKGYISFARKNAKTTLGAAMMLAAMFLDKEHGGQYYSAAAEREQAGLMFNIMASMIRQDSALEKRCSIIESRKRIILKQTGGVYVALSAEAKTKHGLGPSVVIFDELHVQRKPDLFEALSTGSGARNQPLFLSLTTAGYDRNSICWQEYEYARKVQDGIIKDPVYFSAIWEMPEGADWRDEANWKLANPGLGSFRSIEEMRDMARQAEHSPAMQNTFRRLYLNQWTQQSNRAIDMALWDANASGRDGIVSEEELKGRACYGGLDLSAVSDLTAEVLLFPREEDPEAVDILCRFWCPESKLTDSTNRYRNEYQAWKNQGFLTTTPDDAIDYAFIRAQILEDARKFQIIDMNVDRLFQGYQMMDELGQEGLTVIPFGMGYKSMTPPMNEFFRRLLLKKLHHGGNPVLRFMADSLAVTSGPAGNDFKPDKAHSQGKIDGIVALVMGLDRAMRHETGGIQIISA